MTDASSIAAEVADLRSQAERSSGTHAHTLSQRADLVERIGDGSQLELAHYPHLSYRELCRLREVAPERYAELSAGREPGQGWRPVGAR